MTEFTEEDILKMEDNKSYKIGDEEVYGRDIKTAYFGNSQPVEQQPQQEEPKTVKVNGEEFDVESVHSQHKYLVRNPFPKKEMATVIQGKVLDLRALSDYITYHSSPKVINTLVTNAMTIARQEILGVKRRRHFKAGSLLWIIIGAGIIIGVGMMMLMYGPQITAFFKGFMGGMT